MTIPCDGVRFIPGSTDILIVAPHSPIIKGEYQNDRRTGIIAEKIPGPRPWDAPPAVDLIRSVLDGRPPGVQ